MVFPSDTLVNISRTCTKNQGLYHLLMSFICKNKMAHNHFFFRIHLFHSIECSTLVWSTLWSGTITAVMMTASSREYCSPSTKSCRLSWLTSLNFLQIASSPLTTSYSNLMNLLKWNQLCLESGGERKKPAQSRYSLSCWYNFDFNGSKKSERSIAPRYGIE